MTPEAPLAAARGRDGFRPAQELSGDNRVVRMLLEAPSVDSPVLAEIVRRLVEVYQPERIYLFGSAARGEATVDSDYDLMVIVPDDTPPEMCDTKRAYAALWAVGTSGDILVWPRGSFQGQLHLRASLPSTILREGKLVYGA